MVLVVAALFGAVWVRTIPPTIIAAPEAEGDELPILEPMQLLRIGGEERLVELDSWIDLDQRVAFIDTRLDLLDLDGCPPLGEWIGGSRGLAFEQTVGSLSRASRTEALGALALVFQLARTTEWAPGMFGDAQAAERLGGLLAHWLDRWGERAMEDALLYEPTLAAVLLYGHVMNVAFQAGIFGKSDVSRDRAQANLVRLAGSQGDRRTALGAALGTRYPNALSSAISDADLTGFTGELELAFPELNGECGQ
ncbi:MAG: hypothetical protein ACI8TQ_002773 [Planctomycetota bacterium]|jgi:hypothetical protein